LSNEERRPFHFLKSTIFPNLSLRHPGRPKLSKSEKDEWKVDTRNRTLHRDFRQLVATLRAKKILDQRNVFFVLEPDTRATPSEIEKALEFLGVTFRCYLTLVQPGILVSCKFSTLSVYSQPGLPRYVDKAIARVRELNAREQISQDFGANWDLHPRETIIQLAPNIEERLAGTYSENLQVYLRGIETPASFVSHPSDGFLIANTTRNSGERIVTDANTVFAIEPSPPGFASELTRRYPKRRKSSRAVVSSFEGASPTVCVVDTGLSEIPQLAGLIAGREKIDAIKSLDDDWKIHGHGTAVATLVAKGDGLSGMGVRVISHKILSPDVTSYALSGMFEAVRNHASRTRLFVSSINMDYAPYRTLARFDNLLQASNVCFVNSCGNIDDTAYLSKVQERYPAYLPENPVLHPSQNVHVLGVGAVANKESVESIAKRNELSPFTRCGATMYDTVDIRKPDVVDYGGNLAKNTFDHKGLGVDTFDRNGAPWEIIGTSFSAPLVARMLASIEAEYGARCRNSETLKAILFAMCSGYSESCYGLGRVSRELQADNRHAVLIGEGALDLSESVEEGMIRRNRARISFRVPRDVDTITLFVVHSDDYRSYDYPTLDTFMHVTALKDGRVGQVPQTDIGPRKSYVKIVQWSYPGKTMLGRWSFQLHPEPREGIMPGLRRNIQVRFGCAFVLQSKGPRDEPLTDAFIAESKRIESEVIS
jgi:Subtilase family